MTPFNLVFPGSTALVLCFCISLIFLAAVCYVSRLWYMPASSDVDEKGTRNNDIETSIASLAGLWGKWSWVWSWRWEGLPLSLPVSFSVSDHEVPGVGVGKGLGVGNELMKMNWQVRQSRPGFERPLPTLYESNVPLSMAKLIISRQMQRKPPSVRPPRRASLPPSQRLQSMV